MKGLIREVEAIPKLFSFAMIGFQQWSGRLKVMTEGQPFSQCHLYNMVFVNLEETQNVQYDHHRLVPIAVILVNRGRGQGDILSSQYSGASMLLLI